MLKNFEGARLGIFIFLGSVLLILFIFFIGNKDSMFVKTINIKAHFANVEGLKPGAPVRLSGYDIGNVSSLILVPGGGGKIEVTMQIQKNMIKFVRLDSQASIETEGLVGKKIVAITPGSDNSPVVEDGSFILSKEPLNVSAIIEETQAIMAYVKNLTKDFSEIVNKINQGEGTIGKIVNDDALYRSTVNVANSADKSLNAITNRLNEISDIIVDMSIGLKDVIVKVDSTMNSVDNIVGNIKKGKGTIGGLLTDRTALDSIQVMINNLVQITNSAKSGADAFAENMEALKRNWLFKSYFEQRGYWSNSEYQQSLDNKLKEIEEQQRKLNERYKELKKLEESIKNLRENK